MNLPGAVLRLATRDPLPRRSPSSIPRSCCDEPPPTKSAAPQKYRTSEADVKGFKWRIATRRGDARRERFPFVLSIQDSPCPPFCVCQALSHVMMRSILLLLLLHAATNIRAASPLPSKLSFPSLPCKIQFTPWEQSNEGSLAEMYLKAASDCRKTASEVQIRSVV